MEETMRLFWTLGKALLALVLIVPVAMIALATALGLLGVVLGLTIFAIKLAIVGAIAWGAFRLFKALFGSSSPSPRVEQLAQLPPRDVHYEAAMRELDLELGEVRP
jgi:xanthosine utilization system XapX-like protein